MQLLTGVSTKIFDHPLFSINDFSRRWEKARISSLQLAIKSADIEGGLDVLADLAGWPSLARRSRRPVGEGF